MAALAQSPAGAQQLVKAGVVERALAALRAEPRNEALVKPTLQLLAGLGRTREVAEDIVRRGGVGVVVETARANPGSATVLVSACDALAALAGSLPDPAAAFVPGGETHRVRALVAVLREAAAAEQVSLPPCPPSNICSPPFLFLAHAPPSSSPARPRGRRTWWCGRWRS